VGKDISLSSALSPLRNVNLNTKDSRGGATFTPGRRKYTKEEVRKRIKELEGWDVPKDRDGIVYLRDMREGQGVGCRRFCQARWERKDLKRESESLG
jgi:ssDNA-binding Zn-finger/Zn-ribbon topoisomerase 1